MRKCVEQSRLYELLKAFVSIENSHKSDFLSEKTYFRFTCATCSKLPSNKRNMEFMEYANNQYSARKSPQKGTAVPFQILPPLAGIDNAVNFSVCDASLSVFLLT